MAGAQRARQQLFDRSNRRRRRRIAKQVAQRLQQPRQRRRRLPDRHQACGGVGHAPFAGLHVHVVVLAVIAQLRPVLAFRQELLERQHVQIAADGEGAAQFDQMAIAGEAVHAVRQLRVAIGQPRRQHGGLGLPARFRCRGHGALAAPRSRQRLHDVARLVRCVVQSNAEGLLAYHQVSTEAQRAHRRRIEMADVAHTLAAQGCGGGREAARRRGRYRRVGGHCHGSGLGGHVVKEWDCRGGMAGAGIGARSPGGCEIAIGKRGTDIKKIPGLNTC